MIRQRHPLVAEFMLETLSSDDPGHFHLQGAGDARSRLEDMGFRALEWRALVDSARPLGFPDPDDVGPQHCGWQRVASMSTTVWPRLSDVSRTALTWECWVVEVSRWNPPQHVCAGKLAPRFSQPALPGLGHRRPRRR